jgi:hypothetical protein
MTKNIFHDKLIGTYDGFVSRRFIIALGLLAFVSGIDFFTGYELQFFVFYFIPIAFAALGCNKIPAYSIAIASSVCWLSVDILSRHPYNVELYRVWNTFIRMFSFILIVALIDKLKWALFVQSQLNSDLSAAMAELKVLKGILPICCSSKKFEMIPANGRT